MGVGEGASLFPGGHSGAIAVFGRWRRGLTERLDLGVDALAGTNQDEQFLTGKVAARYRVLEHARLEAGMGVADSSTGKAVNADVALTVGTAKPDATWNYYGAVRALGAYGVPGDIDGNLEDGQNAIAPANVLIAVATVGATGRVSSTTKVVFEFGIGPEFVRGQHNVGIAHYLGVAVLFDVGDSARGGP
jgi:hypothetical protein